MKKLIKFLSIGLISLVVLIVLASSSGENTKQAPSSPKDNNKQTEEVFEIGLQEFINEFDKNQLAAEEKYKGKLIKLTGYIDNISEDILGSPFIILKPTPQEYYFETQTQCFFEDKAQLTPLENGQKVTIEGRASTQDLGIISVEECNILGD